ncbi:sterile alpha motif domain-containing protein 14 isoform X5 [Pan paniscus]|uniref:sterile alpha motif domain-containing protein 14 isoform X5 n=1 Tax=Pan paniscus TaxID=9597 RepID=UPI0024366DAA|nr:sterile alpha motif domain-containing protein 14 isoform X5 [Pan paniscus]
MKFLVTDGCGSPLHRLRSPLHSGPGSPAGGSFCLDPPGLRRSLDEDEPPPSPLTRYRPLHNAASHEGLAAASCSPPRSAPSSDSSPSFVRRHPRAEPHSEDDSRDASPPEPASPTIGLDKKTRRKFLDLGVTLRRASTGKSRKEKGSNRLSMGSRESVEGSGRSGGSPFLPFSWFTDSGKGSASSGSTTSPACSPKHEGFSPKKSASQESTLSDDSTPPSSSPKIPSGPRQEAKCSYPYHTLSQSSDEFLDEPLPPVHHWTSQQVGQWLQSLNLEQYAAEFAARQVDGPQLLQLDGSKLKEMSLEEVFMCGAGQQLVRLPGHWSELPMRPRGSCLETPPAPPICPDRATDGTNACWLPHSCPGAVAYGQHPVPGTQPLSPLCYLCWERGFGGKQI